MDLLTFAIPFFLLALVAELVISLRRGAGLYRVNDASSSLGTGILNVTTGLFTRFFQVVIWGFFLQHFAIFDMSPAWFDLSPRGVLLWLVAIVGWDFCYYWFHRISHEMSVFWASHAVHHQSEDYNLSTALRQPSTGFLLGWVFYLPLFIIGFPLEVLVTANAVNLIYQFWVHTQLIDRLGVVDRILVTPSNHRVHHAQNPRYVDRNYGGIFILWDRLFGTFEEEAADEPPVYGVSVPLQSWDPVWANLKVYADLLSDSRRSGNWRDRLRVWFGQTGWRPPDVERAYPLAKTRLASFRKYDPRLSVPMQGYVIMQLAACIIATFAIGIAAMDARLSVLFAPCAALWLTLWSLGNLLQHRRRALAAEYLRLLAFALLAGAVVPAGYTPGVYVYAGLSFVALLLASRRPAPSRVAGDAAEQPA